MLTDCTYISCVLISENSTWRSAGSAAKHKATGGFDRGDFCLLRFNEKKLAMDECSNSSPNVSECSDECRNALETYREEVGCCVSYWKGGVGERREGDPTLADYFSICDVEIPGACTNFSPPKEFLDCTCDPASASGSVTFSVSSIMLVAVSNFCTEDFEDYTIHNADCGKRPMVNNGNNASN